MHSALGMAVPLAGIFRRTAAFCCGSVISRTFAIMYAAAIVHATVIPLRSREAIALCDIRL